MSIITGAITRDGALVDVFVGVSARRKALLQKHAMPVPAEVLVRGLLDTGSHVTGFRSDVFPCLGVQPFQVIPIRTPSTTPGAPHPAEQFDVTVTLVSGTDRHELGVHAIAADDFDPDEDAQAVIGRAVLDRCVLEYFGPHQSFRLSWS